MRRHRVKMTKRHSKYVTHTAGRTHRANIAKVHSRGGYRF